MEPRETGRAASVPARCAITRTPYSAFVEKITGQILPRGSDWALDLRESLGGRALAAPSRAVHVAAPVVRRLRAGPMDLPDGCAQRLAEVDQRARRHHADRATAD